MPTHTDTSRPTRESRLRLVQRVLAATSWAVLVMGLVINQAAQSASPVVHQQILLTMLSVFFALLALRLLLMVKLYPGRRTALLLLLAGIATWAAGSASVNSSRSATEAAHFPAPGEWLFLLSYLGMAGYLMLDVDRVQRRPARGWLDIVVICGGTSCVASLLLVTPIRLASGQEGISLLLALIYPLADVALALAVLGQLLLQVRSDTRKSVLLVGGFVVLALADSALGLQETANTYDFNTLSIALWASAFALLVAAAARPEHAVLRAVPRPGGNAIVVSSGAVALAVLAIRPDDTLAYYTLPPAVVTMAAVTARMVLALREANKAAEAFALSQTDDLTKLPNRRAVRSWLWAGLAERKPLALMMLDLDGFKEINDSLGHRAGDTVLSLVAVRIRESVDADVRVARLGGDEFAIVLHRTDEIELMETAQRVLRELARPISVDGIDLRPSGSIGVTVALPEDPDGGEILRRADVAMYQAKNSGIGVALYDAQLDEFSRSRLQLAEELRRGIDEGQIEVWYQPQLDAATMEVSGLEGLVRWRHPTQGLISPVSFLSAARRAGLMGALSDAVVRQAVEQLKGLTQGRDIRVAINCAPAELLSPTFLPTLYSALDEWDLPPDHLVLEVTEDSFIADPQRTRDILLDLRDHGVQVSIDDYGTGFSSLTYLRNLPIQELKIDRSLVANVASDDRSRMIVASTIQLAHALDMRIVAEGVENAADLACLVAMGIDTLQGYHLARPMPPSEVAAWVRDWKFSDVVLASDEPDGDGTGTSGTGGAGRPDDTDDMAHPGADERRVW